MSNSSHLATKDASKTKTNAFIYFLDVNLSVLLQINDCFGGMGGLRNNELIKTFKIYSLFG